MLALQATNVGKNVQGKSLGDTLHKSSPTPLSNNVLGGQYSLVNNVRGDIFGGDTVHYDTCLDCGARTRGVF